ncbi:MAG: hypothetical protein M1820_005667 [Bogoriella megaspora]|nr:MAG: hypothetical protein M1820_005667 [Bogoriella megaspora]
MFSSSRAGKYQQGSFSKHRAGKSTSKKRSSFREGSMMKGIETLSPGQAQHTPPVGTNLTSAIVTLCVGREKRLFAAHEDVLCHSPFFQAACRGQFFETGAKRIDLPDEIPEVFSSVLEYLYKGDYSPRLEYDKRRQTWHLGSSETGSPEGTIYHPGAQIPVLKDTMIYCTADKFSLPELKRLSLRKQGLQSGISCGTILSSARFAYAYTPDSDSKLRAHYLALIIRSRQTFKRSGTMQQEMEHGGKLFFDLFVAMVNHMDDLAGIK